MSHITPFRNLIEQVESLLRNYYLIQHRLSACDFLMCGQDNSIRGATYLLSEDPGELHLGVHFSETILTQLQNNDPFLRLTDQNLDAFCVLVEEISHFHLLVSRGIKNQQVSIIEIEWQGEIDKLLIAAMLLKKQCGRSYALPLARKLYDEAIIIGSDLETYWQATKHAAQFWFHMIGRSNSCPTESRLIQDLLTTAYGLPWGEKLSYLYESKQRNAS